MLLLNSTLKYCSSSVEEKRQKKIKSAWKKRKKEEGNQTVGRKAFKHKP